jgi:peptidoglycan LD-endopeptidase LytH
MPGWRPIRLAGALPALAAVALAAVLAACGPVPGGSAAARSPEPATTTAQPSTTSQPARTRAHAARYIFPVAGCRVSFGSGHHDYPATDIFAAAGCSVVAPASGVVDEVSRDDRWNPATDRGADRGGLSVSVVGDDGVRYYGSHLRSVAARIEPRVRVEAGEPLGQVGATGSARGLAPHLHFGISWPTRPGIWWVRRGTVAPSGYLSAWQAGEQRSPAVAVRAARARAGGPEPRCLARC